MPRQPCPSGGERGAGFATQGKVLTVTNTPAPSSTGRVSPLVRETTVRPAKRRQHRPQPRPGQDPSVILGTLSSEWPGVLINANGVVFGAGSRVDTQG